MLYYVHLFVFCSWVTRSHVLILCNYLLFVGRLRLIDFCINIVINQQFNVKWNFNYDACSVPHMTKYCHIVQTVCGGEHWWIWWIDFDLPKFCLAKFYCHNHWVKKCEFPQTFMKFNVNLNDPASQFRFCVVQVILSPRWLLQGELNWQKPM